MFVVSVIVFRPDGWGLRVEDRKTDAGESVVGIVMIKFGGDRRTDGVAGGREGVGAVVDFLRR